MIFSLILKIGFRTICIVTANFRVERFRFRMEAAAQDFHRMLGGGQHTRKDHCESLHLIWHDAGYRFSHIFVIELISAQYISISALNLVCYFVNGTIEWEWWSECTTAALIVRSFFFCCKNAFATLFFYPLRASDLLGLRIRKDGNLFQHESHSLTNSGHWTKPEDGIE